MRPGGIRRRAGASDHATTTRPEPRHHVSRQLARDPPGHHERRDGAAAARGRLGPHAADRAHPGRRVDGVIAAALSRDEKRSIADPELAPPYLLAMLQLRAYAFAAAEREPDLAERLREAVLGPRPARTLPRAA